MRVDQSRLHLFGAIGIATTLLRGVSAGVAAARTGAATTAPSVALVSPSGIGIGSRSAEGPGSHDQESSPSLDPNRTCRGQQITTGDAPGGLWSATSGAPASGSATPVRPLAPATLSAAPVTTGSTTTPRPSPRGNGPHPASPANTAPGHDAPGAHSPAVAAVPAAVPTAAGPPVAAGPKTSEPTAAQPAATQPVAATPTTTGPVATGSVATEPVATPSPSAVLAPQPTTRPIQRLHQFGTILTQRSRAQRREAASGATAPARGRRSAPAQLSRNRTWCALAISLVTLAFPAAALGAQTRAAHPKLTATVTTRGPDANARLGHIVLALGSGYGGRDGSPLVRAVQRRLALAGYSPGRVDGLFGPETWRAVVAFQTSRGLRVDGVVGPKTWAALRAPVLILGPGAGDQPGGSNVVRSLQRGLAVVGDAPGPIDGRYGVLTETAVRRFQSAHRLRADGLAGPGTFRLLREPGLGHKIASPREPARSVRGSDRSTPPPVSKLRTAHPQRPSSAAPSAPRASGERPGSGGVPWVIILCGLALAVALVLAALLIVRAIRSARRRDGDERPVASAVERPAKAVILEETHVATVRDRDQATPQRTATRVHTNGHRAEAAAATEGDRTEIRPARSQGEHLPESAGAAGASDPGVLPEVQGNAVDGHAENGRADQRGHGTATSNLGRLPVEQGGPAEAEAAYRRADKRRDSGATDLDVPLEQPGAPDEADAAYRRAVEQGAAAASFNLGVLLEERGDLAAAEEAYRRAEEHGDEEVANMARGALIHLVSGVEPAGAGAAAGAHRG